MNEQDVKRERDSVLAECLALLAQETPELARIVEAWPTLPEAIKRAIGAMIEAGRG